MSSLQRCINNIGTVLALLFIGIVWLWSALCFANPGNHVPETLRVGVMDLPPFVMQNPSGEWGGLSCDLLHAVAKELGTGLELVPFESIRQVEEDLLGGKLDLLPVAVVAASLERKLDYSNAYYQSGSGIAIRSEGGGHNVGSFIKTMLKLFFPRVAGLLLAMWLVAGFLVWLFERRHNHEMFGHRLIKGLGHGIWWAAVTMTTVGYGDKAPKTVCGRLVAVIWMFTSIILISIFTATAATELTIGKLSGKVRGFRDLPYVHVGTLKDSQHLKFLSQAGIRATVYESIEDGLQAVSEKELDAFVFDAAIMKHIVKKAYFDHLQVLPEVINRHYVSMAFPEGSALREPLNRALLKVTEKDQWKDLEQSYLGPNQ